MEEIFRIGLSLLVTVHLLLFIATSFRFRKWSESEEEDLIFGIPFLFILMGTIGSFMTVGLNGITSIAGIPVLLLVGWRGRFELQKPRFLIKWQMAGFLLWVLFFSLRIYVLYDFELDQFFCAFHDDYSYLMQINLLEIHGVETGFWELIRKSFDLNYNYTVYHYIEFYFILLLKPIFGGNTFGWFNIFLKVFLNTFAIISSTALFYKSFKINHKFWSVVSIVLLFFTTLRFNVVDDFIGKMFNTLYFKSVFFQNYYFPSPLSYHVSYKIALAFLFLIPIFSVLKKKNFDYLDSISIILFSSIVSIAILPLLGLLFAGLFGQRLFKNKNLVQYILWVSILFLAGIQYYIFKSSSSPSILQFSFSTFFKSFNLIFENFYWHLFYFSLILLFFTRIGLVSKISLMVILGFPLVYLSPGILFKVYAGFILGILVLFFIRKHSFTKDAFVTTYIPSFIFLYFLVPIFPSVANLSLTYSNYLFPIVCLCLIQFLFEREVNISLVGRFALLAIVLMVNIPAISYDNKTPLHREVIPKEFFKENVLKDRCVRMLSINNYPTIPYLHRHLLGQGILNRLDNIVVANGGFENFDSSMLEVFRSTGYLSILFRTPAYEEMVLNHKTLEQFLKERNVKVVLLEKMKGTDDYLKILLPMTASRYYEKELGYHILVLK